MELLRDLTDTGCTIVCTTHVLENVYLMDQLAVMAEGKLIFQGTPEDARAHFGVSRLSGLYERLGGFDAYRRDGVAPRREPRIRQRSFAGATQTAENAVSVLLARQWAILRADPRNFALLFGQPVVIAALVSWVTNDASLALFFAYIATLWFGCSNAGQEIVRELSIYRRERIVGVGRHAYLSSKFLFLGLATALQALIFYAVLQLGEQGLTGSMAWQIAALIGSALAAVGIGSAISALARSVMQSVLLVPVIIIPLILFSGYTVPANEMKPEVLAVSRFTPTFAAQRVMDVSFLWQKRIDRLTLGDHWTSFRNVNRDQPMRTGETYTAADPSVWALVTQGLWMLGSYAVAFAALRFREK